MKCLGMEDPSVNTNTPGDPNVTTTEGTGWTSEQRSSYTKVCADAYVAQGTGTQEQANSYCSCMVAKLEAKMSYAKASVITSEELQTEEWIKEIQLCKGGN